MRNKEKYLKEIIDFAILDGDMAVDVRTKKPIDCNEISDCYHCLAHKSDGTCDRNRIKDWAEEEYKEQIKLTPEQVQELEYYHAHGCTHVIIPAEGAESLLLIRSNNKPCSAWSICKYPQLEKLKNYDIQKLLEDNKNEE